MRWERPERLRSKHHEEIQVGMLEREWFAGDRAQRIFAVAGS